MDEIKRLKDQKVVESITSFFVQEKLAKIADVCEVNFYSNANFQPHFLQQQNINL